MEWFDQNPLGQVGVVLIRDRLAETLVPMGGEFIHWLSYGIWKELWRSGGEICWQYGSRENIELGHSSTCLPFMATPQGKSQYYDLMLIFLGNPQDILAALSDKRKLEPSGEASLQNGLLMAKGGMA